jgi:peptidoglycan/LPS O-acetylase OafA/YrhL
MNKVNVSITKPSGLGKRADIQYLRAFSVCIVIIFHSRARILPNGYLGVDLFFLISGFVLTPQILKIFSSANNQVRKVSLNFLKKRFNRLIPAFSIATLFNLLILFIFGPYDQFERTGLQAFYSLIFIGNISAASLSGNYFSPNPNPFLHYWSLSAEWQIYLFIPILFSLIVMLQRRSQRLTILNILTLIFVFSLLISIFGWKNTELFGYFSPITRIWQFAAGSLIFITLSKSDINKYVTYVARLILALGILMILLPIPLERLITYLVSTVVFISLVISKLQFQNLLGNSLMRIGDISYSLYLYHLPFIYLALYAPTSGANEIFRAVGVIFAIVFTFIAANFSYKYLESNN